MLRTPQGLFFFISVAKTLVSIKSKMSLRKDILEKNQMKKYKENPRGKGETKCKEIFEKCLGI